MTEWNDRFQEFLGENPDMQTAHDIRAAIAEIERLAELAGAVADACLSAQDRAEKAGVELASLRIADARRTVALARIMESNPSYSGTGFVAISEVEKLGNIQTHEIVAAARLLLEST